MATIATRDVRANRKMQTLSTCVWSFLASRIGTRSNMICVQDSSCAQIIVCSKKQNTALVCWMHRRVVNNSLDDNDGERGSLRTWMDTVATMKHIEMGARRHRTLNLICRSPKYLTPTVVCGFHHWQSLPTLKDLRRIYVRLLVLSLFNLALPVILGGDQGSIICVWYMTRKGPLLRTSRTSCSASWTKRRRILLRKS